MFSAKYTVVYVEILAVCFLFALVMRMKVNRDLGTKYEVRAFKWMLHIFMTMEVLDAVTQIHYAGFIHPPLTVMGLCYSTYMFLIGALSLVWLYFAEQHISETLTQKKAFYAVVVALGVFFAVICFASVKTGWLYYFDEQGIFQRGPLFVSQNAFSYISIFVTSVHALVAASRTSAPARKRRMYTLASFLIAPLAGSLLQWLIGGYPMVGPCICIGIMFVFVTLQDDSINMDALTGLNNRKSLDRYVEDIRGQVSEHTPFYVFILDADDFKTVNDRQGHIEGDRALRRIADALRMTGDMFNGFIARFGGDEFIAVISGAFLDNPELFVEKMNTHLQQVVEKAGLGYPLSVSIGYARYASTDTGLQQLIAAADEMLYKKKKERS